jgi:hypothetical protein
MFFILLALQYVWNRAEIGWFLNIAEEGLRGHWSAHKTSLNTTSLKRENKIQTFYLLFFTFLTEVRRRDCFLLTGFSMESLHTQYFVSQLQSAPHSKWLKFNM